MRKSQHGTKLQNWSRRYQWCASFCYRSRFRVSSRGYRRLQVLIARNTINNHHLRALFPLQIRFILLRWPLSASYHRQADIHTVLSLFFSLGSAPRHSHMRYIQFANGYCSYSCPCLEPASQPAREPQELERGAGISDKLENPATRISLSLFSLESPFRFSASAAEGICMTNDARISGVQFALGSLCFAAMFEQSLWYHAVIYFIGRSIRKRTYVHTYVVCTIRWLYALLYATWLWITLIIEIWIIVLLREHNFINCLIFIKYVIYYSYNSLVISEK